MKCLSNEETKMEIEITTELYTQVQDFFGISHIITTDFGGLYAGNSGQWLGIAKEKEYDGDEQVFEYYESAIRFFDIENEIPDNWIASS